VDTPAELVDYAQVILEGGSLVAEVVEGARHDVRTFFSLEEEGRQYRQVLKHLLGVSVG